MIAKHNRPGVMEGINNLQIFFEVLRSTKKTLDDIPQRKRTSHFPIEVAVSDEIRSEFEGYPWPFDIHTTPESNCGNEKGVGKMRRACDGHASMNRNYHGLSSLWLICIKSFQ